MLRDAEHSPLRVPKPISVGCVRGVLQGINRPDKEMDINIVVGEILQNIIRYGLEGGNPASLRCNFHDSNEMKIIVTDNAPLTQIIGITNTALLKKAGMAEFGMPSQISLFEMLENGNKASLHFVFDS